MGWVKLNIDGAVTRNPGASSAGGLIRNDQGCWLKGFSANLGRSSNIAAELWAILLGLRLAWEQGYRRVVIELDAQVALTLINNASDESPYWNMVAGIRELLGYEWECCLEHSWREGNCCVDYLAQLGKGLASGMTVF